MIAGFCGERIFCTNQSNISGRKCATIRLNHALIDLSVQQGNHCSLKIYQSIYIDLTGCVITIEQVIFAAEGLHHQT